MTNILGVRIHNQTPSQILHTIEDFLQSKQQHHIATVNPEFLVDAQYDQQFKHILNSTSLNTVDGFGIKLAGWLKGVNLHRQTGVDLIYKLVQTEHIKHVPIFLLGGRKGVAYATARQLKRLNPQLQIAGTLSGFEDIHHTSLLEYNHIIGTINRTKPKILLVAYSAPIAQKFIHQWLSKMPSVKVAIGVGGSFDFITGKVKRAPKLIRYVGMEWLWRLLIQPWRIKRIYKAVFKFLYLFIKYDFIQKNNH